MQARATNPEYLRYQYADSEKLRIRADAHRLYSERPNDWQEWVLAHLAPEHGQRVLDGGCGPGFLHRRLAARGVRLTALDFSPGMIQEARDQAARFGFPMH